VGRETKRKYSGGEDKVEKRKKKRKGKKKEREKRRSKKNRKNKKMNYLFFRYCDLQFILTILLLNNKNKI
jgi:hypothetical protein